MQAELMALMVAITAGAVVFGCWAIVARRRLAERAETLERTLAERTEDLESLRLQVQRLLLQDPLTGVATHEQLFEGLEGEWRRAKREGVPLSLVLVDVDAFQAFNDRFGREAGDDCLRQVGRSIARLVGRPGDIVARYQGDEFGLLLAATGADGARVVAEKIRLGIEALQIPSAPGAPAPVVTVSVAVTTAASFRDSEWDDLDLVKTAGQALREAQRDGGNRVRRSSMSPVVIRSHGEG